MKFSSWRTDIIEINAKETKEFAFYDTKPNQFYLQNMNNTDIFISLSFLPTNKNYEYKIPQFSSDAFGRPLPTNYINIYNPSEKNITVTCFSVFEENFDISILKNYSAIFDNITIPSEVRFDGAYPLPSGNNEIGIFKLNSSQLQNLISQIQALNTPLSDIKTINSSSKSFLENILNNIDKFFKLVKSFNDFNTDDTSITTKIYSGTTQLSIPINGYSDESLIEWKYKISLSNDGENDVLILFASEDGTLLHDYSMTGIYDGIVLKAGEIYENILVRDSLFPVMLMKPLNTGEAFTVRVMGY